MTFLLVIGVVLLVLWLLGLLSKRTLGGLIHVALVIAVVLIIIWLLKAVFNLF
jgi:hypothetical protein